VARSVGRVCVVIWPLQSSPMRVGLVHDWLAGWAGSERVFGAIAELYPDAPIYTLVCDHARMQRTPLAGRVIHTSFLQRMPGGVKRVQRYLPLMPLAVEQLDLRGLDVVISSNHAIAKGVLTGADQLHISYIHTPVRYAWDLHQEYLAGYRANGGVTRKLRTAAARALLHYIRLWDASSAQRVDYFIANSHYVARRVRKTYRREAQVLHPPVDVSRFRPDRQRDAFYLVVGRLVGYKRVRLIVEAFNKLGLPLVVIGDGPERRAVSELAGANIQLLGERSDAEVADYLERCRALVFAAEEDFGIVPVEAQAAGAPVIAYGRGGVRETVIADETGVFYDEPQVEHLCEAVQRFEASRDRFDPSAIRSQAERFEPRRFREGLVRLVEQFQDRHDRAGHDESAHV